MLNRRDFLKWTGAIATTPMLPQIRSWAAERLKKPGKKAARKKQK